MRHRARQNPCNNLLQNLRRLHPARTLDVCIDTVHIHIVFLSGTGSALCTVVFSIRRRSKDATFRGRPCRGVLFLISRRYCTGHRTILVSIMQKNAETLYIYILYMYVSIPAPFPPSMAGGNSATRRWNRGRIRQPSENTGLHSQKR